MVSAIATHGRQWYWILAWLAVGALLVALVARSGEHWAFPGPSLQLDQPAPAFTLTTFGGAQLGSSDIAADGQFNHRFVGTMDETALRRHASELLAPAR